MKAITSIVESLYSTLKHDPDIRKYLESDKYIYKGFPADFKTFSSRNSIAIELGNEPFSPKSQDSIKKAEQPNGFYAVQLEVHVGYTETHKEQSFEKFLDFVAKVSNAIENSAEIQKNKYVKYKLPPIFQYDFTEQNRILYRLATITLEYQGIFKLGQL